MFELSAQKLNPGGASGRLRSILRWLDKGDGILWLYNGEAVDVLMFALGESTSTSREFEVVITYNREVGCGCRHEAKCIYCTRSKTSLAIAKLLESLLMALEPHFTVFIRCPFPRGDFIDPPPVKWDSTKDQTLWDILSRTSKGREVDCLQPPCSLVKQIVTDRGQGMHCR